MTSTSDSFFCQSLSLFQYLSLVFLERLYQVYIAGGFNLGILQDKWKRERTSNMANSFTGYATLLFLSRPVLEYRNLTMIEDEYRRSD